METKAYRIVSEWDIGEEDHIYATKELAEHAIENNPNIQEILDEDGLERKDWRELEDEGLVFAKEVTFVTE